MRTVTGVYTNDFSLVFSSLLEKTGVTCYKINQYTHLDQAYLHRLRNGERKNPTPATVIKIALALAHLSRKIGLHDIEALFNSVGRSIYIR